MKSRVTIAGVAVLIVLVLLAGSHTAREKGPGAEKQIKVGAILPMSGDLGFVGTEIERGMRLALRHYADTQLQLIVEDDQTATIAAAVSSAQKLVHSDGVDILFNSIVNTLPAIAPVVRKGEVPTIVVWDDNQKVRAMGEGFYTIGFSTEGAGEDSARLAREQLGLERAAVISIHDEWSEVISGAFKSEFTAGGGSLVLDQTYDPADTDFRTAVLAAKTARADVLYAPVFPGQIVSLVKQARALGYTGSIVTGDVIGENELRALGSLANGIYMTQLWLDNSDFEQQYVESYGISESPTNLAFAALGYDAITAVHGVLQQLKEQGRPFSAATLRSALDDFAFQGLTGLTVLNKEHAEAKKIAMLQVQDESFHPVEWNSTSMARMTDSN